MKKSLGFLLMIVLLAISLAVFLASCSKSADMPSYTGENEEISEEADSAEDSASSETSPVRKIIYEASLDLYTDDLGAAIAKIRENIAPDEWIASESVSSNAIFVIRIKSDRLDDFLNAVSVGGDVQNVRKEATDISIQYQDVSNRVASLQAERARLNELYANASISDMISINQRLAEVDLEIGNLQGSLNEYDSLVDYSRVSIYLYENEQTAKIPFGEKIANVFKGAWKALVVFFGWIAIAATAVFPFAVVFVPAGVGIYFLARFIKKKKKNKKAVLTPENHQKTIE